MQAQRVNPGLCEQCRHADVILSGRGGMFYRCLLSRVDPRFDKYPRLPVLRCDGFSPLEGDGQHTPEQRRP